MKASYTPKQAALLFQNYSECWWIAGGWAIDLFLGEQTREHEDVDIAILRNDEQAFRTHLQDWELWPGLGNSMLEDKPITLGETLSPEREVLWCRPSATSEWAFELLLNRTLGDEWVFKRDERIRKSLQDIGSVTKDGTQYLHPEIILLFKAKNNFDKDQHDFRQALPRLSDSAKTWLRDSLQAVHPGHPWLTEL